MIQAKECNRRAMLRTLAGAAAALSFGGVQIASAASRSLRLSADDVKSRLRGPLLSIPTPFTKQREVDYAGVRRMIERGTPFGIKIAALTSGNGMYDSLSYEEICNLTRLAVEMAPDNGLAIAATGKWEIEKTLEYAKLCTSAGADALQVLRPETKDEDVVFKYLETVARGVELPLVLHGEFSPALLERLIKIDKIVAMKEDVGLEAYIQVQRKFGDRLIIFEGGPEYAFLVAQPYGARASYTTLGTFVPQLTQKFWRAIDANNMDEAYRIVKTYEHPFFDRWSHAFWRASLECFGVAQRYLRPPLQSFTDDQMREVSTFFKSLGLVDPP